MSTDAETRVRLRNAVGAVNAIAPTAFVDVYEQEATAILQKGKERGNAIRQVLQRMALEIVEDLPHQATFLTTQSTKHSKIIVYFEANRVVSFHLVNGDASVEIQAKES